MGILERIVAAANNAIPVEDDLDMANSSRVKNLPAPEDPDDAISKANAPVKSVNGLTGDVTVSTSSPISRTDFITEFTEPGVSVQHDGTELGGGRITLTPGGETGDVISRESDNRDGSLTTAGLEITPTTRLSGVKVTVSSQTDPVNGIRLLKSDGTTINSKSISGSSGQTFQIDGKMVTGDKYYVEFEGDGRWGAYEPANFPYTGEGLSVTAGAYNGSGNKDGAWAMSDIEAIKEGLEGAAYVEFPSYTYVGEWDRVVTRSYRVVGTVDYYIEEDRGTGFEEVSGPFKEEGLIDVGGTPPIRVRIELSRSNEGDYVSADALFRRHFL